MKVLVNVILPVEPFNSLARSGKAGEIISRVIEEIQPESIYFTDLDGCRAAIMIVNITDASTIPAIAEPWFLNFEAACEFKLVMTPEELMQADIGKLASKWYDVHVI